MLKKKAKSAGEHTLKRIGPAEEKKAAKPIQLNEFVYLLPSCDNQCLEK